MTQAKKFQTTQHPALIDAAREQAERNGQKLSEWVGEVIHDALDADLQASVPDERLKPGRPRPAEPAAQ